LFHSILANVRPIYFLHFILVYFLGLTLCVAQNPIADFQVTSSPCIDQNINVNNISSNATTFEWDFCANDFSELKEFIDVNTISGLSYGTGFKLIEDNGQWFGFVLAWNNDKLFRLDFGNSPLNAPAVVDLGDPLDILLFPQNIEIVKQNGNWFGFITNIDAGAGIKLLDFGSSLTNLPTAISLGAFGATGRIWDTKVVEQGTDFILTFAERLTGDGTNKIYRVNFRNSFYNSTAGHVYISTVAGPTMGGPNAINGLDVIWTGIDWKVLVTSNITNEIHQFSFGNDLLSSPVSEGVYPSSVDKPYRIVIEKEANEYFVVVSGELAGDVRIINYKNLNPINTPVALPINSLAGMIGIDAFRFNGKSILLGVGTTTNLKRAVFESMCGANVTYSTTMTPADIHYESSGQKKIELIAQSSLSGEISSTGKDIVVTTNVAPDIAIDFQNVCAGHDVNFFAVNPLGDVSDFSWDFDGSGTSSLQNPIVQFSTSGDYAVSLDAIAGNGCHNYKERIISIFNGPAAQFASPPVTFCSNQVYSFTNTSTYDIPSNPTWEWRLSGAVVSTTTNLNQAFASTATQVIELKASIPGCSSTSTQTFNGILTGPLVDFSASTGCQGSALQFTNTTSGTGIDYSWDFGDGNISTQINPANTYSSFGNFDATLHADNGVCNNSSTKPITIYSKPQVDFSLDLPPFSCQGTPSQLNDLTPNPTDSNLSSWSWSFGDASNGTSGQRNPLYTYSVAGPYNVSLTVTTNFGCSAFAQKMVTITAAPPINFNNTPACLNQPTQFTDASGAGVKSWLWKIGNSTYTISNPVHTFATSGSHNVTLTITGANDCIAQLIKTVTVPVAVTPSFSVENACSGKSSAFLDITSAGVDPVLIRDWDFGGLGSANGQAPKFIFPVAANYIVKLKTTHQSGCVYIGTKAVSIAASPKSLFTSSSEGGPPPLNVKFSNSSTGASSYLWKFNDKSGTTSSLVEPSFTFNELGDYQVELISFGQLGCTDSFSKPIRVVEPITDLSLTNLELLPDPNSGSLRPLVTIRNNGNIAVANVSILIDLSGGGSIKEKMQIDLQPNQSFTQALASELVPKGLNYVCAQLSPEKDENLLNNRKCSTLGEEVIVFAPYPNPSEGELYIDWIAASGDVASIAIFNSTGGSAFDKKITATQPGLSQIILDVSNLGPGIYFVVFSYGGITKTHRFVMN